MESNNVIMESNRDFSRWCIPQSKTVTSCTPVFFSANIIFCFAKFSFFVLKFFFTFVAYFLTWVWFNGSIILCELLNNLRAWSFRVFGIHRIWSYIKTKFIFRFVRRKFCRNRESTRFTLIRNRCKILVRNV